MSDLTCTYLVKRGKEYFMADASYLMGSVKHERFSVSPYDARRFKSREKAMEKAKKINGVVVLFDRLNGELI